jgi:hypothetical protein
MSLCKYKDIFGVPGTGSHSYRIFDVAIVDVLATILVAYIISKIMKVDFIKTLVVLFLLGIVMHRLFCVRTTVDKLLF